MWKCYVGVVEEGLPGLPWSPVVSRGLPCFSHYQRMPLECFYLLHLIWSTFQPSKSSGAITALVGIRYYNKCNQTHVILVMSLQVLNCIMLVTCGSLHHVLAIHAYALGQKWITWLSEHKATPLGSWSRLITDQHVGIRRPNGPRRVRFRGDGLLFFWFYKSYLSCLWRRPWDP